MAVGTDKPRGTTRSAVESIGSAIVSGLPHRPGDLITLEAITAGKLTDGAVVSRAMAREIVAVLHSKRLVQLQARTGATVLPVEKWDVFDPDVIRWRLAIAPRFQMRSLTELRQAIEPRAAHLAAQRAAADVCRDLVSLSHQLRALGTDSTFKELSKRGEDHRAEYSEVDVRFHETLLRGSGNEMVLATAEPMMKALTFRIEQDWEGTPGPRGAVSSATGTTTRFPRLPAREALWFHIGLAYAVDQGHPAAAEAFSCAILAEIRTGGLEDAVLRYALRRALKQLDPRGFHKNEWEPFAESMTKIAQASGSAPAPADDEDEDEAS